MVVNRRQNRDSVTVALAWASIQSDLTKPAISPHCPLEEALSPYANFAKSALRRQKRLGRCPGRSEFLLSARVHKMLVKIPRLPIAQRLVFRVIYCSMLDHKKSCDELLYLVDLVTWWFRSWSYQLPQTLILIRQQAAVKRSTCNM